jgi:hypothetical protein
MKLIFLSLFMFLNCNTNNINNIVIPTTLDQCKNYDDTLYVLNYYSYNEFNHLKPPCDCSPDPDGCLLSRYNNLKE